MARKHEARGLGVPAAWLEEEGALEIGDAEGGGMGGGEEGGVGGEDGGLRGGCPGCGRLGGLRHFE